MAQIFHPFKVWILRCPDLVIFSQSPGNAFSPPRCPLEPLCLPFDCQPPLKRRSRGNGFGRHRWHRDRECSAKFGSTLPWPVWLSWLGVFLQTKGLWAQLPVRACAWVVVLVPIWCAFEGQPIDVSLLHGYFCPSLLLSLPVSPKIKSLGAP